MKQCEFTVGNYDLMEHYTQCPNNAKYITPGGPMKQKKKYVCGVHKNSVDKLFKRINSEKRCVPIKENK